ncbi:hypothetical protein ACEPAH_1070 [Sanghuangporus vaninii]
MSLLRACSSSLACIATSSSSVPRFWNAVQATAALHTSAVRSAESQKQRIARIVRKTNVEKKEERARLHDQNKPHVVLGTHPEEEERKWRNCDLAKVLVTPEELRSVPAPPLDGPVETVMKESGEEVRVEKVVIPEYTSFGLDGLDGTESWDEQRYFFFHELPQESASFEFEPQGVENNRRFEAHRGTEDGLTQRERRRMEVVNHVATNKARQLARIVDLRNANARGIAFENRRRIIAAFSPSGKAADSGYPEVQVALLTMKIRNVWKHLMERKKDIHSRRSLRLLVHQRAKMLKYIKRIDRDRYDRILERVGAEPEAVEGELVV